MLVHDKLRVASEALYGAYIHLTKHFVAFSSSNDFVTIDYSIYSKNINHFPITANL